MKLATSSLNTGAAEKKLNKRTGAYRKIVSDLKLWVITHVVAILIRILAVRDNTYRGQ